MRARVPEWEREEQRGVVPWTVRLAVRAGRGTEGVGLGCSVWAGLRGGAACVGSTAVLRVTARACGREKVLLKLACGIVRVRLSKLMGLLTVVLLMLRSR